VRMPARKRKPCFTPKTAPTAANPKVAGPGDPNRSVEAVIRVMIASDKCVSPDFFNYQVKEPRYFTRLILVLDVLIISSVYFFGVKYFQNQKYLL